MSLIQDVQNPLSLAGRSFLVTGASSGIGRETSRVLADLGARLVLVGRNQERLSETRHSLTGNGHLTCVFDLCQTDALARWVKELADEHGSFHGLVHCAGIQLTKAVRFVTPADIAGTFAPNTVAALLLCKGFCQPGVLQASGGSLVLISSVMGRVGQPALSVYCATKAAVEGMVRALALELAHGGIRVNCVAPGLVNTEMMEGMVKRLTPEQFLRIEKLHPLGIGLPRDVAWPIAFLLSDAARWITGTTLVVDGGYTAQ